MRTTPGNVSRRAWARCLLLGLLWLWLAPISAATPIDTIYPQARNFFPQADRFGELSGQPRAAPVYQGKTLLGYLLLSSDSVQLPAYSGRPINTLIGLDRQGRIVGVEIVGHQEPILAAGISEQQLKRYVDQYRGLSATDRVSVGAEREGYTKVDGISGATITVMVESATIMRSARAVAESRGLGPAAKPAPTAAPPPAAAPLPDEEPVWITVWRERTLRIGVLLAGLTLLTLILIFQDWFARRPTLLGRLRTGYLLFTLFFIGWYTLAQLSIVNVLTFAHSLTHGFQWENFLIDPMIFILWGFVAMTLLLWGRGVYCGWLCPFGALQELTFQLARRFKKLPFFEMPQLVHERLWALKYIILLALFGVSLQSLSQAEYLAEVEPFKTAITLRWSREWGFVLFAAVMALASAINRKFYCKYLCALGAALTIPAKFHIFDWLRRHRECGRPCQICAVECEVQAIKKNGEINPNECHYCLDCQVTYWSARKCPPLVDKRRRREKSAQAREKAQGTE